MELARQLRDQNHDIKLLFVTGYTDYTGQGYEVSAMDYILKLVKKEKLFAVIDRFRKALPDKKTYLFYIYNSSFAVEYPGLTLAVIETSYK